MFEFALRANLLSLLVAACVVAQDKNQPTEAKPRPSIRVVKLEGDPRMRGLAHGKALRDEIDALVKLWKADLKKTYGVDADDFIRTFREKTDFETAAAKWTPTLLEEVRGIAEGCGIDYDTMFVFQLIDEIWAQGRKVLEAEKCTSLGVDRRDGQPTIVAQTLDIPEWYHGYQTLLHIVDEKAKLETFVVTLPGLVGANGLNSARVGVAVNTLLQLQPCTDGLPVAFVVRGVLARKTWREARAFLYDVRHASGQNYIVGGPDLAHSFECSAHRVVRYRPYPEARHTFHTNHPLANEEWSDVYTAWVKTKGKAPKEALPACPRFTWLSERFGEKAAKGGVGLEKVLDALRSKGRGQPICNRSTFATTVMLLGPTPELRVSAGGADRNELKVFRFVRKR